MRYRQKDRQMAEKNLESYDHPFQIEPFLIEESRPVLIDLMGLAHELCLESARLDAKFHKHTAQGLEALVAGVNCYYSNLIEGYGILPIDIDKTMQDTARFDADNDYQSIASAHIFADRWAKTQQLTQANLPIFPQEIHRLFYQHLPVRMLILKDGSVMTPGAFRQREVCMGGDLSPKSEYLPILMNRYAEVYGWRLECAGKGGIFRLTSIVAAFAAHHRLVWIHPFADGNGRVARITLDAMLRACGVSGTALWSMSRGLAKRADSYRSLLAQADQPRPGDLHDSGRLTERALAEFCRFGLQVGIDQARLMANMFDLSSFGERVHSYFRHVRKSMLRPESAYLYMYALTMGEFERGEAARLTGLGERTARTVLSKLLAEGFLVSETPKGKVRVGFPAHAMPFLLPDLYPHGDIDITEQALRALHPSNS